MLVLRPSLLLALRPLSAFRSWLLLLSLRALLLLSATGRLLSLSLRPLLALLG